MILFNKIEIHFIVGVYLLRELYRLKKDFDYYSYTSFKNEPVKIMASAQDFCKFTHRKYVLLYATI